MPSKKTRGAATHGRAENARRDAKNNDGQPSAVGDRVDARGGEPDLQPKRVADSQVRLSAAMNPEQANPLGDVHGGVIMKLVDEAGAIAAIKHARNIVVTVAIDSMTFLSPVHVGDLVTLSASVNWVGRTSIEVGVRVEAENVLTGKVTHTNSAYLVYVALDSYGQPTPVPPVLLETDMERRRWEEGAARQSHRLKGSLKKQGAHTTRGISRKGLAN